MHALEQSCPCELCSAHLCSNRSNVHKKNTVFETVFQKCTCTPRISFVIQSRVLELEEKKISPALFRTKQPPIPQAVHLREKRARGYINTRLRTCVRKRRVVVMQSECDTWVHSTLLALPAALPSSGRQTAREVKHCCCVSAQMHTSNPAGVLPLPLINAHVLVLQLRRLCRWCHCSWIGGIEARTGWTVIPAVSRLYRHKRAGVVGVKKGDVLVKEARGGDQTDERIIKFRSHTVHCSVPGYGTLWRIITATWWPWTGRRRTPAACTCPSSTSPIAR